MNETTITIVGNVVDEPKLRQTDSSVSVTSFRIASTSRRFDKEQGRWIDHQRLFVGVTCWRALAENVAASLHKGQPVMVTGRFYGREYRKGENLRVSYELDAVAVGHDLARGTASFTKLNRTLAPTTVEVDDEGIPANLSSEQFDAASEVEELVSA